MLARPGVAAPGKVRIAIPDFATERGMDESLLRLINEMVLTDFSRSGFFDVIGGSDLNAMLELGQQKALLGCEDDSCLAEIGNALGVDLLGVMRIGRIGSRYFINMKVVNVRRAKVEVRWSEAVPANEDALMDGVARSISKVLDRWRNEEGSSAATVKPTTVVSPAPAPAAAATSSATTRPVETASARRVPHWAPWTALGVGVVGAAAGAFFGVSARNAASERDSALDQRTYVTKNDDALGAARNANISLGVGVVALAAAAGLWWWDRATIDVALSGGDGSVAVSFSWAP